MTDPTDSKPITSAEVERTLWEKFWSKDFWLATADIVDAWRVYPRTFLTGYGLLCWKICMWAMSLKDISTQQTFFISTIVGLATAMLAFYVNSGRKWDK